jgi:two-component system response regulator AtoC
MGKEMADTKSMTPSAAILVIDDEENMRHMLSSMLKRSGYAVDTAGDGEQAITKLKDRAYDFILCDIKMPKMDGITFLKSIQGLTDTTNVIMMSAYGTVDLAVEAMKLGAYDFISKPFKNDEIRLVIQKARERNELKNENRLLKEQIKNLEDRQGFGTMVARSSAMQALFEMTAKVAQYNTTVLIYGESGTGKELVAQAIHDNGPRRQKPMVPVNCGSIPETLLETELFGHVKGAFTGADTTKKGLFEMADGGTLFLDEIGELPTALQVKLLRVLQESEIRPVGATHSQPIDVRVLAATSRDLLQMMTDNTFREDLYYRLNVLTIEIPPLRERSEDIPLLCQHFIDRFNQSLGRDVKTIEPAAMARLLQYHWPGNIRELENAIERAMVLSEGDRLEEDGFTFIGIEKENQQSNRPWSEGYSIKDAQKAMEKELIVKALKSTAGNRTQAARLLEISHPSLLSKMKLYEIDL